jgi:hypothetical protein
MLSYFTKLNRKRVPADRLDFITHCTNPIVHASDDLSVMQSLEALPFITRSARAIFGDKPYRIGPSTIPMRQNPYGSATKDNPDLVRIAMANRDPRHNAMFAAAWTVGYAARVAPAGLEQLVLSAFAGPFGLIAGTGEPVASAGKRPLFHIVGALARLAGLRSIAVETGDDSKIAIVAALSPAGSVTALVANLVPQPVGLDLTGLTGQGEQIFILDGESLDGAEGWRVAGANHGQLELPAYAVAKIG